MNGADGVVVVQGRLRFENRSIGDGREAPDRTGGNDAGHVHFIDTPVIRAERLEGGSRSERGIGQRARLHGGVAGRHGRFVLAEVHDVPDGILACGPRERRQHRDVLGGVGRGRDVSRHRHHGEAPGLARELDAGSIDLIDSPVVGRAGHEGVQMDSTSRRASSSCSPRPSAPGWSRSRRRASRP